MPQSLTNNMQGSWRSAFGGTHPAPFTLANGSVISVAMMRMQTDSLELLFLDGCYCAVRLPFKVLSLFPPWFNLCATGNASQARC